MRALAALVLAAAFLPGCMEAILGAESVPAPDFSLTTLDGRNVTLADYAGSVLVLDFMATTCPPCEGISDDLARLRATEGVAVLTISVIADEAEREALEAWASEENKSWDHAVDTDRAFLRYEGRIIPYLVFVDEDGVIRGRASGEVDYARLQSLARVTRNAA